MLSEMDPRAVEELLLEQTVGRLGIRGDDRVYVYPISYGYDGDYVYMQSSEGLKLRLLRTHPEVCFEVEDFRGPGRWSSVMAHGAVEELTEERDRDRAFATIMAQAGPRSPASLTPYLNGPDGMVVLRLRIERTQGRHEDDRPVAINAPA